MLESLPLLGLLILSITVAWRRIGWRARSARQRLAGRWLGCTLEFKPVPCVRVVLLLLFCLNQFFLWLLLLLFYPEGLGFSSGVFSMPLDSGSGVPTCPSSPYALNDVLTWIALYCSLTSCVSWTSHAFLASSPSRPPGVLSPNLPLALSLPGRCPKMPSSSKMLAGPSLRNECPLSNESPPARRAKTFSRATGIGSPSSVT